MKFSLRPPYFLSKQKSSAQEAQATSLLSAAEIADLRTQAAQLRPSIQPPHQPNSQNMGNLPTSSLGNGTDYAESRPYQAGDDPRTINWRLSARSSELYVKHYHKESRPSLCIVLDQRRSMQFGTRTRLKIAQALRVALVLAFAAEQERMQLNIVLINNKVQWLGEQHSESLLQQCNQLKQPHVTHSQTTDDEVFALLSQQAPTGSLIYLISDFIKLEDKQYKELSQPHAQFFIQALHIIDATEQQLPISGGMVLQDMHQANSSISIGSEAITMASQALLDQKQKSISDILAQSAITHTLIPSHQELLFPSLHMPAGH